MAQQTHLEESGFLAMSRNADRPLEDERIDDVGDAGQKAPDVHTDQLAAALEEGIHEFVQIVSVEVRAQPIKAVAWAATAGLVLGFLSAR